MKHIPARRRHGLIAVRAEERNPASMQQLALAFENFKSFYNARVDALEEAHDDLAKVTAVQKLNGNEGFRPADPEYSDIFKSYFRAGDAEGELKAAQKIGPRAEIQAAMSVGSNGDGGYLAPTEWDRRIQQALQAVSPMRRLATVRTTGVNAYSTLWNDDAWGSGWVGETAARAATATPTLAPIIFGAGEIYANAAITQRLLDDADMNLELWLADSLDSQFAKQEGIAFISGDGVNKPFGLLQYVTGGAAAAQHPAGVIETVNSGSAATILNTDILVDFNYKLKAPYRQNATWLMNSQTAGTLAKFKDGDGNYIWRESLLIGQPSTLLGRPVEIDEGMPNIAANALPIAFGDFQTGFLINDRLGTRILRDPYSNKPFVNFYATRRVGSGLLDPNAIKLLKISA